MASSCVDGKQLTLSLHYKPARNEEHIGPGIAVQVIGYKRMTDGFAIAIGESKKPDASSF